jgi:hypothetical protein
MPPYSLPPVQRLLRNADLTARFRHRRSLGDQNLHLSKLADDDLRRVLWSWHQYLLPKTVKS